MALNAGGEGPTRLRRSIVAALWVAAAVAAAAQAWAGLRRPWHDRLSDLQVYLGGVDTWLAGGSLYDFAAPGTGAPFTYPPLAGLLFVPIAYLNTTVLMVGWSLLTVLAVAGIALICGRAAGIAWQLPAMQAAPVAALLLFLSAPVSSNLRFGQISVFLVLLILLDALHVVPTRFLGVATGLAAAIKLTPIIFVPYLWVTGQRRAAATALGTFAVATGLAWALLPGESLRYWTKELLNVERVGNIATGGNQSLNGAMLRLGLADGARIAVVFFVGGTIVLVALWRATKAASAGNQLAATVMVGSAGLVFSPVSWTHHQVWLVVAAFVPVSAAVTWRWLWVGTVAVVMIAPVTSIGATLVGGVVWGNARLLLAVAIACVVPFVGTDAPRIGAARRRTKMVEV